MNDTDKRAATQQANDKALLGYMAKYNFTLSHKDFQKWRPTKPSTGEIGGVGGATIVATDGNLGMFVRWNGAKAQPETTNPGLLTGTTLASEWVDLLEDLNAAKVEIERADYSCFLGHIHCFSGKVEPLFSSSKSISASQRKPEKSQEEKAANFLKKMGITL